MKSLPERIKLPVRRNLLIKAAPALLWLIAIFLPVLVGRHIYLDTFIQEKARVSTKSRNSLMTRAHELESKLKAEEIIQQRLQVKDYARQYQQHSGQGVSPIPASFPLLTAMPALKVDPDKEIASFSAVIKDITGIEPVFIAGLSQKPEHCGLYIREIAGVDGGGADEYRQEFASLWRILNNCAKTKEQFTAKQMASFSFFSQFMGIFEFLNTELWKLDSSFSNRYRERLFFLTMPSSSTTGEKSFFIVGITASSQNFNLILQNACRDLSNAEINLASGRSKAVDLPVLTETSDVLSLTIKLPEAFLTAFKPGKQDRSAREVIKLSLSIKTHLQFQQKHINQLNLAVFMFLSATLLLAVGTSLGRLKLRASLAKLIIAAFLVSMFLPISSLAWLAAAESRATQEAAAEKIIQLVRQQIRQCEIAFKLQSYRQQLLMLYLGKVISGMPAEKWGDYVDRFFFKFDKSSIQAHVSNFYLYSTELDHEFYRGKHPEEKFRRNELPRILSGACRKVLLNTGAFDHLSESGRQKMAQLADFSSGVLEGLVENSFYNNLFSRPAELNQATLLARREPLSILFIRRLQKMLGMLCLERSFSLTAQIIDELNARGSFKNKFNLHGHRVETDFFMISNLSDGGLHARVHLFSDENPRIIDTKAAAVLFSNSDSVVIDNMHLSPPHILLTDTLLNRKIFAVTRIHALPAGTSSIAGPLILTILVLTSCLALATGISRLILMPLPPFLAALKEIEHNRYDWKLNLQTGDEFDKLANSINKMKVSLLERKKMLQLVSQTAAAAVKSGEDTREKPKRQPAVILVSDIRGFTSISENNPAEEVVDMLNQYFSLMCPAIEEQGGYIDKLIGDAIQAVFVGNDPQQQVISASKAALEMRKRLKSFNAGRSSQGLFEINNGIGIASGIVTTGLTGSRTGKLEAAVLGDPLQKAALLESYSRYATQTFVIIDEESYLLVAGHAKTGYLSIETSEGSETTVVRELYDI